LLGRCSTAEALDVLELAFSDDAAGRVWHPGVCQNCRFSPA